MRAAPFADAPSRVDGTGPGLRSSPSSRGTERGPRGSLRNRARIDAPYARDDCDAHRRRKNPDASSRSREAGPRGPRSQVEPAVGDRGDLPVRSQQPARAGLRHRHAAADGERFAPRRSRLLVHPHRRHRALPAHVRQGRLLPDGVGRQRAADRAPRPELLRRPLRSVAAVRSRPSSRPTSPASRRSRCRGRTSSRCASA